MHGGRWGDVELCSGEFTPPGGTGMANRGKPTSGLFKLRAIPQTMTRGSAA
jgi:hypothetical protein